MIYFVLGFLFVSSLLWLYQFRRDDLRPVVTPAQVTDEMIQQALQAGHKITAIRYYRVRYGVGLKEAKEAVEALQRSLV